MQKIKFLNFLEVAELFENDNKAKVNVITTGIYKPSVKEELKTMIDKSDKVGKDGMYDVLDEFQDIYNYSKLYMTDLQLFRNILYYGVEPIEEISEMLHNLYFIEEE